MAAYISPVPTIAPRDPKRVPEAITVTATNEVTVFITDEVTISVTTTFETTTSIFETSFIHVTDTITNTLTIVEKQPTTTITQVQTPTLTSAASPTISRAQESVHTTAPCSLPSAQGKHVDPFQVLTIVFGILILVLLALMWFLVRRFYKMYRAERVMRKQLQTEGTEMPPMKRPASEEGNIDSRGGEDCAGRIEAAG